MNMVLLDDKRSALEVDRSVEQEGRLGVSPVAICAESVEEAVATVLQGQQCALVRDQFDKGVRYELERYLPNLSMDIMYEEASEFFDELHRELVAQSVPEELAGEVVENLVTVAEKVQSVVPDQTITLSIWRTATTADGEEAFDDGDIDPRMFHCDGSSPNRKIQQDGRLIMTIAGPVATTFVPPQICPYTRDEVNELSKTLQSQDRDEAALAVKRLTDIINHAQPTNPGDALVFGEELLHAPDMDTDSPRLVFTINFRINHSSGRNQSE
jgi:hypothetical protein